MTIELKPCPFCGGPGKLCPEDYCNDDMQPYAVVECDACNAWVPADAWQKRATEAHCRLGELCNCGGDSEQVRDGCAEWVRAVE